MVLFCFCQDTVDSKPRPEGENRAGDAILEAGERMRCNARSAKHKQAANPGRVRYAPMHIE